MSETEPKTPAPVPDPEPAPVPLAAVAPAPVASGDTVTIGSTSPVALRIEGPATDPEDPRPVAICEINGNRHESAVGGVALTHGVPAGMLEQWLERHPHLAAFLRVMSGDEIEKRNDASASYGFEPGLAATIAANEDAGLHPGDEIDPLPGSQPVQQSHPLSDPAAHEHAVPEHEHQIETKHYADGTSATGVAPLPDTSPGGAPVVPNPDAPLAA